MKNIITRSYVEAPITFTDANGQLMLNATQMAKPFGKKPNDYFRNKETNEFLDALLSAGNYGTSFDQSLGRIILL